MRALIAAALSLTLIGSSAMAAGQAGSLPPGKPAGVRQAQGEGVSTTALLVIGGIVVIGTIIGVSVASDGNPPSNVSASTVSTSAP
jgi:hypothetical protein